MFWLTRLLRSLDDRRDVVGCDRADPDCRVGVSAGEERRRRRRRRPGRSRRAGRAADRTVPDAAGAALAHDRTGAPRRTLTRLALRGLAAGAGRLRRAAGSRPRPTAIRVAASRRGRAAVAAPSTSPGRGARGYRTPFAPSSIARAMSDAVRSGPRGPAAARSRRPLRARASRPATSRSSGVGRCCCCLRASSVSEAPS